MGASYIAAIGSGITIIKRDTLEIIHRFSGIPATHGGVFLDDDTLAVFTGKQRILFFSVMRSQMIWSPPRPRELSPQGDMKCCKIGDTSCLACIAQGKHSLEEHFLLLLDYKSKTVTIQEIPHCFRVVSSIVWTAEQGLSFLTYQANDEGSCCYKVVNARSTDDFFDLYTGCDDRFVDKYSGRHLFFRDYRGEQSSIWLHSLSSAEGSLQVTQDSGIRLKSRMMRGIGPFAKEQVCLPHVLFADNPEQAVLILKGWVGVYQLPISEPVIEMEADGAVCAAVIDEKIFVGCASRIYVQTVR